MHDRQPVLAALFRRLDGELLPFLDLRVGLLVLDLRNAVVALQRDEFGDTQLGRLLDDQVHRLCLGQRLRQPDRMRRARRGGLRQNGELHGVLGDLGDARLGFMAVAVEDTEVVTDVLAHDLRAMVRLLGIKDAAVEGGCVVAFHGWARPFEQEDMKL